MANYNFTIQDKIDAHIERIPFSGCWIWTGATASKRYGALHHKNVFILAHRASYEINVGPIPHGMEVCHRCDIGFCVNPDHLFIGSHADNMMDMAKKGRSSSRVLSEDQVVNIIKMRSSGFSPAKISKKLNVSASAVDGIIYGKTWKHITNSAGLSGYD